MVCRVLHGTSRKACSLDETKSCGCWVLGIGALVKSIGAIDERRFWQVLACPFEQNLITTLSLPYDPAREGRTYLRAPAIHLGSRADPDLP